MVFVVLSDSDPTGCKAQATAKKSKEFKIYFEFIDTSPKAQYDKK